MPTASIDQLKSLNQSTFQSAFASFVAEHKPPALIAGLMQDGELSSVYSHGLEGKLLTAPEHVAMRIASMTKCFAAAAILKLRDSGALSLEDSITKYLPLLKGPVWEPITIFQLLTMQSGLPTDDPWGDRLLGWSNQQFENVLKTELTFAAPPGSEYHYSNLGYMILGALIATIASKPAISYISDEILQPLGMHETCWNPAHVHWLIGHSRHRDKLVQEPVTITEYDGAVFAGIWSTVSDLCRWMSFMMDLPQERGVFNEILSPDSRKFMQQSLVKVPRKPTAIEDSTYGLGLGNYTTGKFVYSGHSGGLPGYGSHFRWCTELGCAVVAMSNITYAPVMPPCQKLMSKISDNISSRQLPVPALVQRRALEVYQLIADGWNENSASQIFSSNFFLDNPVELFREDLRAAAGRLDQPGSAPWILMQRGLQARVMVAGDELFSLMLAPAENARVQQLTFPWIMPAS